MHPVAILQLLVLLSVANGAPVLATKLLGSTLAQPIDGGVRFIDRRPLLGGSKTIRGVVISMTLTIAAAPLLGLELSTGAVVGAAAMAGDLVSSFIKRRLDMPSSSQATGLDQLPESLFPLLACRDPLPLTLADIVIGVLVLHRRSVVVSGVLQFGLRDRPY